MFMLYRNLRSPAERALGTYPTEDEARAVAQKLAQEQGAAGDTYTVLRRAGFEPLKVIATYMNTGRRNA